MIIMLFLMEALEFVRKYGSTKLQPKHYLFMLSILILSIVPIIIKILFNIYDYKNIDKDIINDE